MKNRLLKQYLIFHKFTVILSVCYLLWGLYNIELEVPEIAYLIEVLLPNLINDLTGGNFADPTDFVNHIKFKLCQIL